MAAGQCIHHHSLHRFQNENHKYSRDAENIGNGSRAVHQSSLTHCFQNEDHKRGLAVLFVS